MKSLCLLEPAPSSRSPTGLLFAMLPFQSWPRRNTFLLHEMPLVQMQQINPQYLVIAIIVLQTEDKISSLTVTLLNSLFRGDINAITSISIVHLIKTTTINSYGKTIFTPTADAVTCQAGCSQKSRPIEHNVQILQNCTTDLDNGNCDGVIVLGYQETGQGGGWGALQ